MRAGLPDHKCSECQPDVRVMRRCPRSCASPADQARLDEMRLDLPPDPTAPAACLILWLDAPEPLSWLDDAPDYRAGHLAVAGGVEDQPARWLAAQRVIKGEVDRLDLAAAKGG